MVVIARNDRLTACRGLFWRMVVIARNDRLLACRGLFWRMVVIARNDRLTACRTCSIDEPSRSTLLPRRCRNRGTHTRASCATHARPASRVSNTLLRSSGATTNHTTPYTSQPFAAYHSL